MSRIAQIGSVNPNYIQAYNVVPTVQHKNECYNSVSFRGKKEKNHAGLWTLGTIAALGGIAILFRKNIMAFSEKLKKNNFKDVVEDLQKNATHSDTCKFSEISKFIKEKYTGVKDIQKAFVMHMDEDMRKTYNVKDKVAIIIGYFKDNNKVVFSKIFTGNKLDQKTTSMLSGKQAFIILPNVK